MIQGNTSVTSVFRKPRLWVPALALCLVACGRNPAALAGGGSGTEDTNGSLVGRVAYPDGTPAAGAAIIVRAQDFLKPLSESDAGPASADAVTDARGGFEIDSLPPGDYLLEIRDGVSSAVLLAGEVRGGKRNEIAADTLRPLGELSGALETPAGIAPGFVQIRGLERLARADSTGHYAFRDLPTGLFQVHAVCAAPGKAYSQAAPVAVAAGQSASADSLTLADFAGEDYGQWPHARKIRLNTAAPGMADTVTGYPLLLRLDSSNFDFSGAGGNDIRFASAAGRHLAYQIERWDAARRKAEVWVRLDTLAGNDSNQYVTLCWGRPGAADFSGGEEVFADYAGVWHLDARFERPGTEIFPEASPNSASGLGNLQATPEDGLAGPGAVFTGGRFITVQPAAALNPGARLSLSAWIKVGADDTLSHEILSNGDNYGLRLQRDGNIRFFLWTDSSWHGDYTHKPSKWWDTCLTGGVDVKDGQWHQVAATYDGAAMRIYLDGAVRAEVPLAKSLYYPLKADFVIGKHGGGRKDLDFVGAMDEARVAPEAWPPGRVRLDFETQKPGARLAQFP